MKSFALKLDILPANNCTKAFHGSYFYWAWRQLSNIYWKKNNMYFMKEIQMCGRFIQKDDFCILRQCPGYHYLLCPIVVVTHWNCAWFSSIASKPFKIRRIKTGSQACSTNIKIKIIRIIPVLSSRASGPMERTKLV